MQDKQPSLGHVVKVREVIDCIVLGELKRSTKCYIYDLEQRIHNILQITGVSVGYLHDRLKKLLEYGYVKREWDNPDSRNKRYYWLTQSGETYFYQVLEEMPIKVDIAVEIYNNFQQYIRSVHGSLLK